MDSLIESLERCNPGAEAVQQNAFETAFRHVQLCCALDWPRDQQHHEESKRPRGGNPEEVRHMSPETGHEHSTGALA